MLTREKTRGVGEPSPALLSRIASVITSMPLPLKLGLLVLITLLPRVLAFLQPQIITNDGVLYIQMAKLFSDGKYTGISNHYFTLYPLMLLFVHKLIGNWELSGQLISIALGTVTVVPIFLLGRSLYSEKVGWLSALFYIILPDLIRFDIEVLRDPTYWFFMLFSLWLVWSGIQKNRPFLLGLASISAGLGAITRVDGVILWGALVFYAAFRRIAGASLKRRALNVTLLIFIFPLIISPILFSMKKPSSQVALGEMVSFSINVIKGHIHVILKPMDPIARIGSKTYESLPSLSKDSLELASRHRIVVAIAEVVYKFLKAANLLIVLIVLGLWKRKKEGFESSDWYLLYIFAALFIMSVFYARQLYYFSTRHGLTLVLPCLFFVGHGLETAAVMLSRGMERLGTGWGIRRYLPTILIFLFVLLFLSHGLGGKGKEKTTIKEAGLWLKNNGYQGSVVMGPKKFLRLAFYGDGKFIEMPDPWQKVKDWIHDYKVRIVVVDSCTIEQYCPDFPGSGPGSGLFLLQEVKQENEGCSIKIYEFR